MYVEFSLAGTGDCVKKDDGGNSIQFGSGNFR